MNRVLVTMIAAVAVLAACRTVPDPIAPPDEAYDTAKILRAQIVEFGLAQHARAEFDAGENHFVTAEAAYSAEEYATAGEEFELAIDNYTIVIRDGFRAVAVASRERATAEKVRADEVRAHVAVPDEYRQALEVYNEAGRAIEAGDNQGAAELYDNSAVLFTRAWELALERRRQAEEAIERVDRRIRDLDEQREALEDDAREDLTEQEED